MNAPTNTPPDGVPRLVPGLVSVTFRKFEPAEIIRLARAAELQAIEWGGDVHVPPGQLQRAKDIGRLTREAGLQVSSYGSYYVAGENRGNLSSFEAVLETALALEAPLIRVWAGRAGSAQIEPSKREEVGRDLARIAACAAAVGVKVALEFHHGTLTDTDESAAALWRETGAEALFSYWQPRHGEAMERAVESLQSVLPRVTTLHVFHWWPDATHRRPLAEGEERWRAFFHAARLGAVRHALLEFVVDDDPAMFLRDAATLKKLLHGTREKTSPAETA